MWFIIGVERKLVGFGSKVFLVVTLMLRSKIMMVVMFEGLWDFTGI